MNANANRQKPHHIKLALSNGDSLTVSLERPELLVGATYIALSPAHPLIMLINHISAVNPLTGGKLPLVADSRLQFKTATVGVPAHSAWDSRLARRLGLPRKGVVAQDFGKPLPDSKDVSGVVVIGYDPKTNQYLGLKNGQQGWLVGGGREPDESYDACAVRELAEEAGYKNVQSWTSLGDPVYSYYYNSVKQSNRRSLGYNYLAIIDSSSVSTQQQESHENFTVWWTDFDSLYADIKKTGGGVDHWLDALVKARLAVDAHNAGKPFVLAPFEADGTMINSGEYDGLSTVKTRGKILVKLSQAGILIS